MIRRGPIRVTIEQRTDDAAVQHAGERLMVRLGVKLCDKLVALGKRAYPQALFILRTAAETDAFRRVCFLQRKLIIHIFA